MSPAVTQCLLIRCWLACVTQNNSRIWLQPWHSGSSVNKSTFVLKRSHVGTIAPHRLCCLSPVQPPSHTYKARLASSPQCLEKLICLVLTSMACEGTNGFWSPDCHFLTVFPQLHEGSHLVSIRCDMTQEETSEIRNGTRLYTAVLIWI